MFSKILFLYSSINNSDAAYCRSVYNALIKLHSSIIRYDIEANCDNETLISNFTTTSNILGNERYVIFAVGEKGSNALNIIVNENSLKPSNAYIGLGIYQYFDIIGNLNLDYIALPRSVLIDDISMIEVILTIPKHSLTLTVPTDNPSIETLRFSYENWSTADKPPLDAKYIIVMLPGDEPDHEKMHYFTVESAQKLFNAVYLLWQNNSEYKLIIENGPRTGKFDPTTGEIKSTHEFTKGTDPAEAIDHISNYFVKLLEQKKISYQFFNFELEVSENGKSSNSVFNQLLYLTQSNNENFFIIPGESVSIIGQIPLYIFSNKAIVFKPSSMNAGHEAIFQQAFQKSFITYFDNDGNIIHPLKNIIRKTDDAEQIAYDLIEGYNNSLIGEEDACNSNFLSF